MGDRIMAINDDQDTLDMYADLLGEEGYEVATHTNPTLATRHLDQFKPELIILDWMFGWEEIGLTTLHKLRLNPGTADVPVIVCSAATKRVGDVEEYLRAKRVAVLHKPFTFSDLLAAVRAALDSRAAMDEAELGGAALSRG